MSAFSPLEHRNTAYVDIQKDIEALETAIRALKGHHNGLSSISRLPAELLLGIFELLARDKMDVYIGMEQPPWVEVSHVCSQWRHIALECPRLWSHIQCSLHPRWTMEMLKRSKMVPITVDCRPIFGSNAASVITAALEQLSRIEDLTLALSKLPKHNEIFSSLSRAAPLLHSFQIYTEDSQAMLPENIFSGPGGAPQLRKLSLDGCDFHWKSELLHSLTHLTVASVSTECRLSVDELVTTLGHIPQLESIHLSSVMVPPRHSEPNASSSPSTFSPLIARIHLADNLMSCLAFFTKFIYPNTAIVSIECSRSDYHSDIVTPVRDLITVVNAKNIVPITSLHVENLNRTTFRGQDSQGIRRIVIDFQDIPLETSSISWDSLTLHHLKSLQVHGIYIPRSVWLSVFGKLKTLKIIFITGHVNEFLGLSSRGISRDPAMGDATSTDSPGKLKFGALKSLSLGYHSDLPYNASFWVDSLVSCFRERRRRGSVLRKLSIDGYGDGAGAVCQLGSVVKHVRWSEVEETTDSEQDYDFWDSDE